MTKEIEVLRNTISAYTDREEQMASQIRALELQVKELHVNLEVCKLIWNCNSFTLYIRLVF